MTRAAMSLALDALKMARNFVPDWCSREYAMSNADLPQCDAAIAALEAELAKPDRMPMTDAQIDVATILCIDKERVKAIIRAVEKFHEIKEKL